jgi:hypothetical protein
VDNRPRHCTQNEDRKVCVSRVACLAWVFEVSLTCFDVLWLGGLFGLLIEISPWVCFPKVVAFLVAGLFWRVVLRYLTKPWDICYLSVWDLSSVGRTIVVFRRPVVCLLTHSNVWFCLPPFPSCVSLFSLPTPHILCCSEFPTDPAQFSRCCWSIILPNVPHCTAFYWPQFAGNDGP